MTSTIPSIGLGRSTHDRHNVNVSSGHGCPRLSPMLVFMKQFLYTRILFSLGAWGGGETPSIAKARRGVKSRLSPSPSGIGHEVTKSTSGCMQKPINRPQNSPIPLASASDERGLISPPPATRCIYPNTAQAVLPPWQRGLAKSANEPIG